MTASILTDEAGGFDAAEAFLSNWTDEDATEPSEADGDEEHLEEDAQPADADEAEEGDEPTDDDDDGEDREDSDEPKTKATVPDDAEVEVVVNGETLSVSVANLKRLYGQEAALTRKSQEVAEMRKHTEELSAKYNHGLQSMLTKAEEALKPYANVDWALAAQKLEEEEYKELRADATRAFNGYKWIKNELDNGIQEANARNEERLRAQAIEATRILSDPNTGIPGWGDKLYNDIRAYAVSNGFGPAEVDRYVDPNVFKILHKAMEFDKAKSTANVKKKDMTPSKVVTKNSSTPAPKAANNKTDIAKIDSRLKRTGSVSDAEAAFEARLLLRK